MQAEAPLIETDLPTISGTLNNEQLTELPRDSRDFTSFLYLNPNIRQGAGDGAFKFLGAQSYGASFSLDGQRSNGGVFGEPTSSQPSLETIGELTVLSSNFTAEYAGIANIRVTTKRGGRAVSRLAVLRQQELRARRVGLARQDRPGHLSRRRRRSRSIPIPYFNLNEFGGASAARCRR